jgi:STAS-like domain of unknown function (DUF4325)
MERILSIAKEFSETPGPRSSEEGAFSGEEFRETLLEPRFKEALGSGHELIVDLDGTVGYATSFLEAAFGGLARIYEPELVLKTLVLRCEDEPSLIVEVQKYIRDARAKGNKRTA